MRLATRIFAPLVLLLAILLPAGTATAAPAQSERTEQILAHFNMCNTGEFVVLEGTIHIVSMEEPGGTTFFQITTHAQGVGDQGNEYVFNDSFHVRSVSTHLRVDERHRLISTGSAPNQVLIFHFDSDSGSTFEIDCRA